MTSAERSGELSPTEARAIIRRTPRDMRPEIGGYSDGISIRALRELGKRMLLSQPPLVVYPGSSVDTGVAEVFGRENVVHIDTDEAAMAVMAREGYKAVNSPVGDFIGDPFDMMIVRSAPILSEELVQGLINPKGYLISNNAVIMTSRMIEEGRLRLVAAHADGKFDASSYGSRAAQRHMSEHLEHEREHGPSYSGKLFLYQKRG